MALDDIIRSVVAMADSVTSSLQDAILFYAWTGNGATYAEPTYASPITVIAIVEEKQKLLRLRDGQEVLQKATITIPRPITANGASGRREPIDPRDKIILSSGYTGPILTVEGISDPLTHKPYMFVVKLG